MPNNNSKKILASTLFTSKQNYVLLRDRAEELKQTRLNQISNKYIPFFTTDNSYFNKLCAAISTSPTNRSIIQKKVGMVLGDGFRAEGRKSVLSNISRDVEISEGDIDSLEQLLLEDNLAGENWMDILQKVVLDFISFGNAFVEVVIVNGQVVQNHLPVSMCRPKKAGNERVIKYIGVSEDFQCGLEYTNSVVDLPIFPAFETMEDGTERAIIHIKDYEPEHFYWGVPSWATALLWAEVEYRIPRYNVSKFENGFTPSAIVQFFTEGDEEEARAILTKMHDQFTDTGNNSKILAQVLRNETAKANVQVLEDKSEGLFLNLQNLARELIITAHEWTQSLAGVSSAGQLGSIQQAKIEFDIVQNSVIKPIQNTILSQYINKMINFYVDFGLISNNNIQLCINNKTLLSFLNELNISDIMTDDEKREAFGLVVEKEEVEEKVEEKQ